MDEIDNAVKRYCIPAGCAKADRKNLLCNVLHDPEYWWARGTCPGLTTNPGWEKEIDLASKAYSLRLKRDKRRRRERKL